MLDGLFSVSQGFGKARVRPGDDGWLPPTRVSWMPRSIAFRSKCDVSKAFFTSSLSSWEAILDSSLEAAMMGVADCGQQRELTSLWVADEKQNDPWSRVVNRELQLFRSGAAPSNDDTFAKDLVQALGGGLCSCLSDRRQGWHALACGFCSLPTFPLLLRTATQQRARPDQTGDAPRRRVTSRHDGILDTPAPSLDDGV